ncbi:putative membrane protein YgcG [Sinorhizobium meliloti]|uniref:hypothetical protein n=1 Tax=Rhizobium meliloti TaxID=382 RepID=UPI00117134AE|nr:hypothetical protein [Sinorhizobium meliloti]MBP2468210.1 putative membrane protein YgcG [Sinorhizobium meliloti]GEC37842.1 hypothetical protein EME01_19140 [Sinorhizobium meliloti]
MDELRKEGSPAEEDRREFLKACGRFAAVTPPAVTILLSTSLTSDAIAASGSGASGGKGGGGNSAKGGKGGNGTKGGKGGNNAKGKAKPGK